MHPHRILTGLAACACYLLFVATVRAQAPGEDPVVITKRHTVQMQPTGPAAAPGQLDSTIAIPSWLRARIARFEARAFSSDTSGVLTDSDVVTTATAQGMQKTCVQEVGSSTVSAQSSGASKYGPNPAPQVVVLRGDLVNVCR